MFKYLLANIVKVFFRKQNKKSFLLMLSGVKILDFKSTFISEEVSVSKENVKIADNVTITGTSIIEKNVTILKGSIINNSIISSGSVVGPYVYINDAQIGANNSIGPFSFIRPETITQDNVKIGAFVEVKKTSVDSYSKIPHLSYVGDTDIGKKVNIGAGVITCNYDGHKKSKTVIGDNVFIGSDSQLIAPLIIESNSYVAAGSTINKKVEENDLAISRTRQVNKKNYAKTLRGEK